MLWPGTHLVPGATAIATDQVPEAHRWNAVPVLIQFQYPSGLQGVPGVMTPAAGLVGAGLTGVVVVLRVVGLRVVLFDVVVVFLVVTVGTVTNTPPGLKE
jgi:hypothetical protein